MRDMHAHHLTAIDSSKAELIASSKLYQSWETFD